MEVTVYDFRGAGGNYTWSPLHLLIYKVMSVEVYGELVDNPV
jgi:hypothetical protein